MGWSKRVKTAIDEHQLEKAVATSFHRLRAQDRVMFRLYYEQGLSVAETARGMGLSQKLVYRRLEGAVKTLRSDLRVAGLRGRDIVRILHRHESGLTPINVDRRGSIVGNLEAARPKVVMPPGSRLLSIVEFVFSPNVAKLVGQPIADLQLEYCEALGTGRRRKATWVRLRGYWSFWKTVLMLMPVSLIRLIAQLWKVSGGG